MENRNGRLVDVTREKAQGLAEVGMVTSALWSDITNDGAPDLIIAGEWMPITVYENQNGQLLNITKELGLDNSSGWWNSISTGDLNDDGTIDYLLGNLGLNNGYNASVSNPLKVVAKDFNNNGWIEPILTMRYIDGYFPLASRKEFLNTFLQKITVYQNHEQYAKTTAEELLNDLGTQGAVNFDAKHLANSVLINSGDGNMSLEPLPNKGQLAPVFGTIGSDLIGERGTDFLLVGNFYSNNVVQGPYCAFTGGILTSDSTNKQKITRGHNNGFYVDTDAKALASLVLGNGERIYIVTSNNDSLKVFSSLIQPQSNIKLDPLDAYAIID